MQRSGTNMVMEIIEQSLSADVYHEYDPRAFSNYEMREPDEIQQLIRRSRGRRFVIKSLCELQDLKALMQRFAPAKTVWVVRRHEDVINSMTRSFKNMAAQVARLADDKEDQMEWLARGVSDETHRIVKALSDQGLDDASASGVQWYFRNVLFFEQEFDRNPDVLLVFYEDLVTHPREEFKKLFDFIGIDFDPKFTRKIFSHSIKKNRSPNIIADVTALCEGLYQRFQALRF